MGLSNKVASVPKDPPGITTLITQFKNHGYTTLSNGKVFHHPADTLVDVLKLQASIVQKGFPNFGLDEPNQGEVREALERYRMFSPNEISQMLAAL